MKFLCLVHIDKPLMDSIGKDENDQLQHDSIAYDQFLEQQGVYITSEALDEPDTATFLSTRYGKVSRTDGPFAETKEHLGGFILIDVSDKEAAITIAEGIPIARYGRIEVRPIMEYGDSLA